MKVRIVVSLLAALTLAGCDETVWFEQVIPKEEAEFSKNYLALFPAGDFDMIEAYIPPNLRNAKFRTTLEQIAAAFPAGNPTDIQAVGVRWRWVADTSQVHLTFQYNYPTQWLLANVTLQKNGSDFLVTGVDVQPLPDSLERINRFTFEGKGARHFAILSWAILVLVVIVVALILCIKTPIPKRKWVWVLFILFGIGQVTLNWSEGSLHMTPLAIQLLGVGYTRHGLYAPWLLTVSLPLGAMVFLLRRKAWLVPTLRPDKELPPLGNP
ncbi:MAG: hypothetical protein MRJ67_10615 [Nitrospirales bacterium]|nr:hypothetical protein [Nitrospirales bacterium]MDR4481739.1 hypothetical protein [Nitrospirales bacterium]